MQLLTVVNKVKDHILDVVSHYTISTLTTLFAIALYFIFLHIDNQQSELISALIKQVKVPTSLVFNQARHSLQDNVIILFIAVFCFLIVFAILIQKLKETVKNTSDYSQDLNVVNRELLNEIQSRSRLTSELETINKKQWKIAFFDNLTGLPNRQLLMDRLGQIIVESRRNHTDFSLLFLDLDNFNSVNDSLGHAAGDQLLVEVGRRLTKSVRRNDTVARIGGDEFIVILKQINSIDGVEKLARTILSAFVEPININGQHVTISCSTGIVLYPHHGTTSSVLLKNADIAMYQAKYSGRNQFQVFRDELEHSSSNVLVLSSVANKLIQEKKVYAYFEAQVEVQRDDDQVIGYEAFVQCSDPKIGTIDVDMMKSLSMNSNTINEFYGAFLESSFDIYDKAEFNDLFSLTFPLLRCQWRRPNFIEEFSAYFDKINFPVEKMIFKVDQKDLLVATKEEVDNLVLLSQFGVGFMISKFSSEFLLLKRFDQMSVRMIELDTYYTSTLKNIKDNEVFLKMIIDLSVGFESKIVAPEVSTPAQKALLLDLGFQYMCGSLWSDYTVHGKGE